MKMLTQAMQRDRTFCVVLAVHILTSWRIANSSNVKSQEKIRFLKERGICFGCLKVGHISRDSKKRLVCEVCDQEHPTALHIPKTNVEL